MGTTTRYAFPYPGVSDAPNGPAQIQALAEALDTKLYNRTKLFTVGAAATAATGTLTGTHVDVAGTSLSFTTANPNAIALITATWDLSYNNVATETTNHIIGYFSVDNVEQTKQALLRTTAQARACVAQNYIVTLASAGSHTFKQRASSSAGAGTPVCNNLHTSWSALILDLA